MGPPFCGFCGGKRAETYCPEGGCSQNYSQQENGYKDQGYSQQNYRFDYFYQFIKHY